MRRRFPYIFLSIVTSITISCRDCPCIRANLNFGLVNFTEAQTDTIILRRFDKSTNFSIQIDSMPFYNSNFGAFPDTLLSYHPPDVYLVSDYNYEIFFPDPGKLFRISEINEVISEQRCYPLAREKVDCVNEITSFKLNGQISQPSLSQIIYLHR